MITVSAKALWWHQAETCYCAEQQLRAACARVSECDGEWDPQLSFFSGQFAGDRLITDRTLALRVNRLHDFDGLPRMAGDMHSAAEFQMADWLDAEPQTAVIPERLFPSYLLDPLEMAGFRVRPLAGTPRRVFGVCDPWESWHVVGLIHSLAEGLGVEADRSTCRWVAV